MRNQVHHIVVLACLGWACANDDDAGVLPCTAANSSPVTALAQGAYASIQLGPDGCASFSANSGADTIEYLVVAQSVATNPNRQGQFRLAGDALIAAPPAAAVNPALQAPAPGAAERFHSMLREAELTSTYAPRPEGAPLQVNIARPPPFEGELRDFKVCGSIQRCLPMTTVTARAEAVGQHLALYVDVTASTGLTVTEYDSIVQVFDERFYDIGSNAFGPPSDRDDNGVVMALMTPQINRLVSAASCAVSGFVAGYFLGSDIDPRSDFDPNYNHGEIFYTLVPDPTGQFSCAHSVTRVKQLVPVVFVHEFQHMISFNYKVIIPNAPLLSTETLWLNEALSHYAEELGGRSYLPGDPNTFSSYLTGNIRNAYDYMARPGNHFLVANTGSGTLGERGAGWLFVRYLIDQLAIDTTRAAWDAVTRGLVQNEHQGTENIEFMTGVPFENTVVRWALALWVSDLPGFSAPPELRYRSWRFRTTYAPLSPTYFPRPYPLEPPVTLGAEVDFSGYLRSGSGEYGRVIHPPGAGTFTLQLAEINGAHLQAILEPRLTVLRVR